MCGVWKGEASLLLCSTVFSPIETRDLYMAWLGLEGSGVVPSPILRQMACNRFTLSSQDGSGVEFVFVVMMDLIFIGECGGGVCYTVSVVSV